MTAGGGAGAKPPVKSPPSAGFPWHWHHLLPRMLQDWFNRQGINDIHDYCVHVPHDIHNGQTHPQWERDWKQFKEANPNATPQQILNKMRDMMARYGIPLPIQRHPKH